MQNSAPSPLSSTTGTTIGTLGTTTTTTTTTTTITGTIQSIGKMVASGEFVYDDSGNFIKVPPGLAIEIGAVTKDERQII